MLKQKQTFKVVSNID